MRITFIVTSKGHSHSIFDDSDKFNINMIKNLLKYDLLCDLYVILYLYHIIDFEARRSVRTLMKYHIYITRLRLGYDFYVAHA